MLGVSVSWRTRLQVFIHAPLAVFLTLDDLGALYFRLVELHYRHGVLVLRLGVAHHLRALVTFVVGERARGGHRFLARVNVP